MLLMSLLIGLAHASDGCGYTSTASTDIGVLLASHPRGRKALLRERLGPPPWELQYTMPEPTAVEEEEAPQEVPQEGVSNEAEEQPAQSETSSLWEDFPYYYQYNNALHGGSSCQNTSLAMVLQHYGVKVSPDDITSRYGKDLAQSPAGLARVFNAYASEAGIPQRMTAHQDGTMDDVDALLAEGKPVIVHGYFTAGHVVVTLGKTDDGYVVNDPAGRWNERWKGGYGGGTATNGNNAVYDSGAFESAIATSDGRTYLPIWYHEITP